MPAGQRHLITLILRKLLASSTFAIARTLRSLVRRLENIRERVELLDDEDLEGIDALMDEWQEDGADDLRLLRDIDPAMLKDELNELRRYADLADSIQNNAKGEALIPALQTAFEHAKKLGAARKAVIFTESRRTQEYLFDLFEGVFGASDEVLGALDSGVDIERRIAQVYQECRTSQEIRSAFDALQAELETQIQARLAQTRQSILEHFDEDVRSRLRVSQQKTVETLSQRERWLLDLTRTELNGHAEFDPALPRFHYSGPDVRKGWYNLDWKQAEARGEHFYRQDHALAVQLIEWAISRNLPPAGVTLDYSGYGSKISILESLVGQSGWLELSKLTVEALNTDEFLIFAAQTDGGRALDEEICGKLLHLPGQVGNSCTETPDLSGLRQTEVQTTLTLCFFTTPPLILCFVWKNRKISFTQSCCMNWPKNSTSMRPREARSSYLPILPIFSMLLSWTVFFGWSKIEKAG